jgi:hypothetical protein
MMAALVHSQPPQQYQQPQYQTQGYSGRGGRAEENEALMEEGIGWGMRH